MDEDRTDDPFEPLFDAAGCWAEPKDVWTDPETVAERTAFFKVLEACLTRLPERTSQAFLMREWLENEPAEICAVLGLTQGNLRVLLHRARDAIAPLSRTQLGTLTMNGNDITCRDTTWIVSDSRDGTLSEHELLALKKHIADCPLCRGASTQFEVLFRGIDRLLKSATE